MTDSPERRRPARSRVVRIRENARYEREVIDAILDEALVCHLSFVVGGSPVVVPTLHTRVGDLVYLHVSSAARITRGVRDGSIAEVCVAVTLLDGLVLARSAFEHGVNYRSVVLYGQPRIVEDPDEKLQALVAVTNHVAPGRWDEARKPTDKELRATAVIAVPLDEVSAKVRAGDPDDGDSPDADLPIWAGQLPLTLQWGPPIPDPALKHDLPSPASLKDYRRGNGSAPG